MARNRARSRGGLLERRQDEFVRIGESGLFATGGTHTNALIEAEAAFAHDAVFERPALVPADLKIQVCKVDTAAHHGAKRLTQVFLVNPCRLEQTGYRRIN